jgi:secondary thiamine-phosphate synthase enzyme
LAGLAAANLNDASVLLVRQSHTTTQNESKKDMESMLKTITIQTSPGESLTNVTAQVKEAVRESGVLEGICVVYVPHTTAGILINSAMDKNTALDIIEDLQRMVPTRVDFHHIYDTPADASGHVKASLVGGSQSLIVAGGELLLGHSQSVMFFEFDGPRKRQLLVRVVSE